MDNQGHSQSAGRSQLLAHETGESARSHRESGGRLQKRLSIPVGLQYICYN